MNFKYRGYDVSITEVTTGWFRYKVSNKSQSPVVSSMIYSTMAEARHNAIRVVVISAGLIDAINNAIIKRAWGEHESKI